MSTIDELIQANAAYAGSFDRGHLPLPPRRRIAILTCMDARILPGKAFGLEEGDAHVIRNAGGRARDALRSLVISQRLLGTTEVAVISLNPRRWTSAASELGVDAKAPNTASAAILQRINRLLYDLPRFAQVRAVHLVLEAWTVQQGLLTPTLKIKRRAVEERYASEIAALYEALKEARKSPAAGRASPEQGSPDGVERLDVAEP